MQGTIMNKVKYIRTTLQRCGNGVWRVLQTNEYYPFTITFK